MISLRSKIVQDDEFYIPAEFPENMIILLKELWFFKVGF